MSVTTTSHDFVPFHILEWHRCRVGEAIALKIWPNHVKFFFFASLNPLQFFSRDF